MIEIYDIKKHYGRKQVLEKVSFTAKCGESVAIVGRNGCGKTTLMQILAGAMKPDGGEIRYFGKEPLKNSMFYSQYCGYVPQDMPLFEELSVRDNLRMWGPVRRDIYERIIHCFALEDIMNMSVSRLSGGMKRRLCIACALMQWPPILLLDEPTTALDIYYKDSIWSWIRNYKEMNGIVIMTTHDEKEILESDRCLVMCQGHLREMPKEQLSISALRKMMDMDLKDFLAG